MNRREFLTGALATPLIIPSANLTWTNSLIRRAEVRRPELYGGAWNSKEILRVIDALSAANGRKITWT